jgi:hypothetical protein
MPFLFQFFPLNAQTTPTPTVLTVPSPMGDPIELLKESKCWFKGKGYSVYSVGYIVRSYVSAGRIKNLKWAQTQTGTNPKSWVVTLSYFDTQKGKRRKARWSFNGRKGGQAMVGGDSGNKFLSCVPGEKYTRWPGADEMDVIE